MRHLPAPILAPQQCALRTRAATVPWVLVIQDTTAFDFPMEGCGPLNDARDEPEEGATRPVRSNVSVNGGGSWAAERRLCAA